MIRERNPETWFASWASSAPVEAQVDMSWVPHTTYDSVMFSCYVFPGVAAKKSTGDRQRNIFTCSSGSVTFVNIADQGG